MDCRIRGLAQSYTAVIKPHPKFGYQTIEYGPGEFIDVAAKDIALIVGDALHNLKSALDYAWIATLEHCAPTAIRSKTQFPAYKNRIALEEALSKIELNILCPALFSLIVSKIKAYEGGNDAIWDVKQLNILDKHRLLLPLIGYTSIEGLEMESDSGESVKGSASATFQLPPLYVRIPEGWTVKQKGVPSIDLLFGEGVLTHHLNAASSLEMYSVIIMQVIRTLETYVHDGSISGYREE